jgi:aspartate/tyrosine/aromatic aminotransferase
MGLYGHRIGLFSTLCDNETERENVNGILKAVARRTYSNPPIQGAKIVKTVLGNPELYKIWEQVIKFMMKLILTRTFKQWLAELQK